MSSFQKFQTISLIYPCYNEEKSIPYVLQKALDLKKELSNLEILVINDGSNDNSKHLLEEYKDKIKIVHLDKQLGYGAAIQIGAKKARGSWLAFCDLDATCEPEDLKKMMAKAQQSKALIVFGNRLHSQSHMLFLRQLGNLFYRGVIFLLSQKKVVDPCSGFRLFQKDSFQKWLFQLPSDLSFSIALTALCIRLHIPYSHVDITYNKRLGQSKLSIVKDGFLFLFVLIKYLFIKKN